MRNLVLKLAFLSFIIAASSCGDDEIDTRLKRCWKEQISNQSNGSDIILKKNIIYDNNTVCVGKVDDRNYLYMLSTKDGKKIWEWRDFTNSLEEKSFHIYNAYQKDNILIVNTQNITYCIDLINGKTRWKKSRDTNDYLNDFVSGIGDVFFVSGESKNIAQYKDEDVIYVGNAQSGFISELTIPPYTRENPTDPIYDRTVWQITPYINNGDTLLVVPYNETGDKNPIYKDIIPKYGVYNLTKRQWKYANKLMMPNGDYSGYNTIPFGGKIYDGKAYFITGYNIVCHDLETGNQIWNKDFQSLIALSDLLIVENKIIIACEDGSIYAISPNLGSTIWSLKYGVATITSWLHSNNGIVYFTTGQHFYGVDISTGKIKVDLSTPDKGNFDPAIRIVPQPNGKKAMLVVNTYTHAYGYEALR